LFIKKTSLLMRKPNKCAEVFIESFDNYVPLLELLLPYPKKVYLFYEWYFSKFQENFKKPIKEHQIQIDKFNKLIDNIRK
jgi:hypothetical protein